VQKREQQQARKQKTTNVMKGINNKREDEKQKT
jgi:hypothetical protein